MSPLSSKGAHKKKSLVDILVLVLIWKKKDLKVHFSCLHTHILKKSCPIFHKKSHFSECKSFLSYLTALTMLPTPLLHKARPSSPCSQCLGLSQNSPGTARMLRYIFPPHSHRLVFSRCFLLAEEKCLHVSLIAPPRSHPKDFIMSGGSFKYFWKGRAEIN